MKLGTSSSVLHFCLVDRSLLLALAKSAFASVFIICTLAIFVVVHHIYAFRNALVAKLVPNAGEAFFVRLADSVGCIDWSRTESGL